MNETNLNINSNDEDLIKSFCGGNESSFNLLVRKYQKKVYWIIRKMVLDHDDADDITQEVFLKLYRSLQDFRGESKFFTYIYRIAVNYSLNHLNSRKKITGREVDIENQNLASIDKNADAEMDARERTKILEEAIKQLPDQQRAVFNMRYYDSLSYEDIAKILNKSVGGMKANYFHAIKKLQQHLKSNEYFEQLEIN